jgi:hypothetical protein
MIARRYTGQTVEHFATDYRGGLERDLHL